MDSGKILPNNWSVNVEFYNGERILLQCMSDIIVAASWNLSVASVPTATGMSVATIIWKVSEKFRKFFGNRSFVYLTNGFDHKLNGHKLNTFSNNIYIITLPNSHRTQRTNMGTINFNHPFWVFQIIRKREWLGNSIAIGGLAINYDLCFKTLNFTDYSAFLEVLAYHIITIGIRGNTRFVLRWGPSGTSVC